MVSFHPARDLSPRLFAALTGWGRTAFPDKGLGYVTIYVLGPIAGGVLASVASFLMEPLMKARNETEKTCCS
jgi:glycerol uptake facilitator protein